MPERLTKKWGRSRGRLLVFALVFAVFHSALFFSLSEAAGKRLRITGSSTLAPLAYEIATRFEYQRKNFRVDVQTGGSSRGIADARRGLADIGMSSRALYDEEKVDVMEYVVAYDGIAFVVHRDNPIKALSKNQARKILNGEIRNWSILGGPDAAITLVNRAKGRSELDLMSKFLGIKPRDIKPSVIAGENQQCVKIVAGNKHAIVYLSIGTAEFEIKRGTPLKLLALDGVEASIDTVRSGSYPVVRPLILVTKAMPSKEIKDFVQFARSSQVHDLVRAQSFVPIY